MRERSGCMVTPFRREVKHSFQKNDSMCTWRRVARPMPSGLPGALLLCENTEGYAGVLGSPMFWANLGFVN